MQHSGNREVLSILQISKYGNASKHLLSMSMLLICGLPSVGFTEGLGTILHQVEQVSPLLHVANARAEAANAEVHVAKSQYWGHAEIFGLGTHYNNDRLVNPISYPPVLSRSLFDQNTYGYGAAYTLPIDIDGRITARVNARKHLSQAAHASVEQTRLSLFGQVSALYRGLQRLHGVTLALNEQHKALLGHQKITATSVRVGRVAAVELLRIEAEIKSVEGQLAGLSGDEARLRANLGALLNTQDFTNPVDILTLAPSSVFETSGGEQSLKNRPDLKAAKSITYAEDENLKGAKREWLPNLSLRAETMRNQGFTAKGANTWSVGAQLSWQFWDGGRRFAHTDQINANRVLAREQYQNTLNQARAEFTSAKADWQAASQQYQATIAGLKASIENERIQSDRFASGRISAVDLIDAEAALARARADHISALANWWQADDRLHLSLGHAPADYQKSITHKEQNHDG